MDLEQKRIRLLGLSVSHAEESSSASTPSPIQLSFVFKNRLTIFYPLFLARFVLGNHGFVYQLRDMSNNSCIGLVCFL